MKAIFRVGKFILLLNVISLSLADYALTQSNAEEIYDKNSPAVVEVVTFDKNKNPLSQGSGCQINEEGLVVTNYHAIKGAYYALVIFNDQTEFEVKYVYAFNKEQDLALIKHYGNKKAHIKIGSSDGIKVGEVCYAIGSPKGFQNTISNGLVSNILRDESQYVFQITNPISPGSSGGGLFNDDGDLIGITTATFKDAQNINFAIPSKYVSDLTLKPFKQNTLSDFQVLIGGTVILYPKKDESIKKKEPPPEPKEETDRLETAEEEEFDFDPGFSYDIGGRFIFLSSALNKDVPKYVEFRQGFTATFSYWFSSYGGLGLTYQKQDVVNKNNGNRINLRLYKGEFLIRTSEHPIRAIMGFGIGLANSEFQKGEDDSGIVIRESSNQFTASANFGIEFMIVNRFSVSASAPVDYILVSDTKSLGVFFISPSVGLNVVF